MHGKTNIQPGAIFHLTARHRGMIYNSKREVDYLNLIYSSHVKEYLYSTQSSTSLFDRSVLGSKLGTDLSKLIFPNVAAHILRMFLHLFTKQRSGSDRCCREWRIDGTASINHMTSSFLCMLFSLQGKLPKTDVNY